MTSSSPTTTFGATRNNSNLVDFQTAIKTEIASQKTTYKNKAQVFRILTYVFSCIPFLSNIIVLIMTQSGHFNDNENKIMSTVNTSLSSVFTPLVAMLLRLNTKYVNLLEQVSNVEIDFLRLYLAGCVSL